MSKIDLEWHYRHKLVYSGDFKTKRGCALCTNVPYATVMIVFLSIDHVHIHLYIYNRS